jgi:GT2 family glycosyltransferase
MDSNSSAAASVAIVILNWNGKKYLEKFLPSVCNTAYPNFCIYVADNASADDSLAFLNEHYPSIQQIVFKENYGFAKGYNLALQQIKETYCVLLNSDVEVTANWLTAITDLMNADNSIAACQPKLSDYSNKQQFEYAGAAGGFMDAFGYPFARGRVFDTLEVDKGQYNNAIACFWATGAALVVRTQVYLQLGGLDEYFFAHQEEIDFCWRAQLAGYKIYCEPKAVVYHFGGGTLPTGSKFKTFLNFRNNLIMLYKNLPWSKKWKIIPFRFWLDAIAAYRFLFKGDFTSFWAIAKSHVAFMFWVVAQQKQSVFPQKIGEALIGQYNISIVWRYFIKKQKYFSEIVK